MSDLSRQVDQLDTYLDENHVSRGPPDKSRTSDKLAKLVIDGFVDRTNSTVRLYATLDAFVASYVTTDSFNTTAKRLESELEIIEVRLRKQEVRFRGWIGSIGEVLLTVLAEGGVAKDHAFYLRETAEQSRYMMSESEEWLAAELDLSGSNAGANSKEMCAHN